MGEAWMFIAPSTEGSKVQSELEGHTATGAPCRAAVTGPKLHAAPAIQLHRDAVEVLHRVIQTRLDQSAVLGA